LIAQHKPPSEPGFYHDTFLLLPYRSAHFHTLATSFSLTRLVSAAFSYQQEFDQSLKIL